MVPLTTAHLTVPQLVSGILAAECERDSCWFEMHGCNIVPCLLFQYILAHSETCTHGFILVKGIVKHSCYAPVVLTVVTFCEVVVLL